MMHIPDDRVIPSWLVQAREAFTRGTEFNSPAEVVQARLKTFDDWVEIVDAHRPPPIIKGIVKANLERKAAREGEAA